MIKKKTIKDDIFLYGGERGYLLKALFKTKGIKIIQHTVGFHIASKSTYRMIGAFYIRISLYFLISRKSRIC
jgi:hypothetical protein